MQHLRKEKSLALKIYDTFDKSAVKNPGECLFSCGHVIVCDFLATSFIYYLFIFSEALIKSVPVERATLLRRSMRKTTSCKKT